MSSTYTPTAAPLTSITLPDDGDDHVASAVNPAFEDLADAIAYLQEEPHRIWMPLNGLFGTSTTAPTVRTALPMGWDFQATVGSPQVGIWFIPPFRRNGTLVSVNAIIYRPDNTASPNDGFRIFVHRQDLELGVGSTPATRDSQLGFAESGSASAGEYQRITAVVGDDFITDDLAQYRVEFFAPEGAFEHDAILVGAYLEITY